MQRSFSITPRSLRESAGALRTISFRILVEWYWLRSASKLWSGIGMSPVVLTGTSRADPMSRASHARIAPSTPPTGWMYRIPPMALVPSLDGEGDADERPVPRLAPDFHLALVPLDDARDHGEPQPLPFLLGRVKGVED